MKSLVAAGVTVIAHLTAIFSTKRYPMHGTRYTTLRLTSIPSAGEVSAANRLTHTATEGAPRQKTQ